MKNKVIKEIPAQQREVVENLTCDICGQKSYDSENWISENFDFQKVTVKLEVGNHYPEGGENNITECDICPTCFTTKLKPMLSILGVTFTTSSYDF